MTHVDFETRDFILRLEKAGWLRVLPKEGEKVLVEFPCGLDEVRGIVRGGSYQINNRGDFLLVRRTPEGIWVLIERKSTGLSGSCLLPVAQFEQALEKLS